MSDLKLSRRNFLEKQRDSLSKIKSLQENFVKKKKRVTADLEEAGRILKELSERFKWWQSLP